MKQASTASQWYIAKINVRHEYVIKSVNTLTLGGKIFTKQLIHEEEVKPQPTIRMKKNAGYVVIYCNQYQHLFAMFQNHYLHTKIPGRQNAKPFL